MDDPQRTGAAHEERERETGARMPGLVLLYSAEHARMRPACPFRDDIIELGREPPCWVVVPENAVSRRHARFERMTDQTWVVTDAGSRNGTFIDGVRVDASRPLVHGDVLRVGDTFFKFVSDGAEDYEPFGIDGMIRGVAHDGVDELLGGMTIRRLARDIGRVAKSDLSCLVLGETGTGKELVARALHRLSNRSGALQSINCAAVPANLFESELFGFKRGAFSGADRDKPGLVHGAAGGTLFLDEIGDMPFDVQAKLLRLLESGEVIPLGATRAEPVDVRVVAATHHDLPTRVADGRFRGDLYARLAEHTFELSPLRERKEDLFLLTLAFLRRQSAQAIVPFDVMAALIAYDWPFNVRELESSIRRAVALGEGGTIKRENLPPAVMATPWHRIAGANAASASVLAATSKPNADSEDFLRGAPKEAALRRLLAEHGGNVAQVARAIGKHRTQVQRYMERYGIAPDEYRRRDEG